ncbi:predicted protein [Postia placenta Mad-698-R]|nr:predicted protein [Postia placenta Mad-698-R]
MPNVVNGYMDKYKDGERHNILEDSDEAKIHEYCVIPHPDLDNSPIREGFTYRFDKVGIIRSHAKPHFMVLNTAMKLKEDTEMCVMVLKVFYERIHLQVDTSCFVEDILTLSDVWTAAAPGEADLIMKEEKEQAAEEALSLPVIISTTSELMASKHPRGTRAATALLGPGGLEMDKHPKSKAHKPEGEPCGSNLQFKSSPHRDVTLSREEPTSIR